MSRYLPSQSHSLPGVWLWYSLCFSSLFSDYQGLRPKSYRYLIQFPSKLWLLCDSGIFFPAISLGLLHGSHLHGLYPYSLCVVSLCACDVSCCHNAYKSSGSLQARTVLGLMSSAVEPQSLSSYLTQSLQEYQLCKIFSLFLSAIVEPIIWT